MDKEILEDFAEESLEILEKSEELVEKLEDGEGDSEDVVKAAQQIDGIMGCAKTMGLGGEGALAPLFDNIGMLSEGFKFLGYRASQVCDNEMLVVVGGVLAEAIELLRTSVTDLKKGYISVDQDAVKRSSERMMTIAKKFRLSEEDQKALQKRFGM